VKNRIPSSKRKSKPQTPDEALAWVTKLVTACNKRDGHAPDANRLDVHLQFERPPQEDPAHTQIH